MTSKFQLTLFFIILNSVVLISQVRTAPINRVSYFTTVPSTEEFYYFSTLNPFYSENPDYHYLMNTMNEVVKFVNLEMAIGSYDMTYGSFVLSDFKVVVSLDQDILLDIVDFVKPVQNVKTIYGNITTLRIAKKHLQSIFLKYNNFQLPDYTLFVPETIDKRNIPSWFLKLPSQEGFIFGAGSYSNLSIPAHLVKNADYAAYAQVIQSLNIKADSELYQLIENKFELIDFFNKKRASAKIGGIFIYKRYFDEKKKIAYSLAVLKIK